MTKTTTKRALIASIFSLVLCASMLIGTTFAWFTDSVTSGKNTIVAGNLDIEVYYAYPSDVVNGDIPEDSWKRVTADKSLFNNDALWEPGYTEVVYFKIVNNGSLALKYLMSTKIVSETPGINKAGKEFKLSEYLTAYQMTGDTVTIYPARENAQDPLGGFAAMFPNMAPATLADAVIAETSSAKALSYETSLEAEETLYTTMVIFMPTTVGNEANHNGVDKPSIQLGINVLATQYTSEADSYDDQYDKDAEYPKLLDIWDGTADTSWYDPSNPQSAYDISTAEQLAGLAELVSGDTTFAGVTFTLTNDVDLFCEDTTPNADGDPLTFRPIGDHSKDGTFEGVFDGNGKTISNLYQNGWDLGYQWGVYGSYGLFGNLNNATVKNLTISGTESYIEGGDVSFVAGSATGTCVFENITIKDGVAATYNNGCGGIIGWSGAGDYTFKNITLAEDVVLGGLWGSFDSSIGGIVGQGEPGATYNFENVNIACRLDCYNDVTAAYKYYLYRMTGMLIGRLEETTTIDGSNYPDMSKYNITCKDVTVTYGDWVDYHYCVVAGKTAWRVEPGYAYDGIPADHDHSTCAVAHDLLLPFEGLFGGDQYGVRPITEYDGVTVNYNK